MIYITMKSDIFKKYSYVPVLTHWQKVKLKMVLVFVQKLK